VKKLFHDRRRWTIAGVFVGLVIAGAAIAAIIATARVNDNTATSPEIFAPPPPPPALAVAIETSAANCSFSLNYQQISSAALFNGAALDYSDPYGSSVAASAEFGVGDWLCIKNLSPDTSYRVDLALENVASVDLGCPIADETDAGDTTCGFTDPGELDNGALTLWLAPDGGNPLGICNGAILPVSELSLAGTVANLDPGGWCAFIGYLLDTNAYFNGVAPDPIYGTDDIMFDLAFSAEDASGVVLTTWYADFDGDGFGDPGAFVDRFTPPAGYVGDNTDCDDGNALVNPAATEVLGDLIDNNCNGLVDEGP